MCCLWVVLVFLGPRVGGALWWLVQPARWNAAFTNWLWPLLGLIFVPWATIMWVLVAPLGSPAGWDWLWIGLGLVADIAWWAGAAGRRRVPGYAGTY
jgi:hypothetical protein